jgi:hypothetical protein
MQHLTFKGELNNTPIQTIITSYHGRFLFDTYDYLREISMNRKTASNLAIEINLNFFGN